MNSTEEIFKPIPDYPNYLVSNLGRVKNIKKDTFMNGCLTKDGFIVIKLNNGTYASTPKLHSLVANAFIPNTKNAKYLYHIDGDKTNNVQSNIKWTVRLGGQHVTSDKQLILLEQKNMTGLCVHEECNVRASYNYIGFVPYGVYCKKHCQLGMCANTMKTYEDIQQFFMLYLQSQIRCKLNEFESKRKLAEKKNKQKEVKIKVKVKKVEEVKKTEIKQIKVIM